jgi:hypothetical protein
VVVAQKVEEPVDKRRLPVFSHHVGTEHDVAELTRHLFRKHIAAVEGEGKNVGRLVQA